MKFVEKITILQPFIAHYREDFYLYLSEKIPFDLLCVSKPKDTDSFKESSRIDVTWMKSIKLGSLSFFNPFSLLLNKNKIIVTTWDPRWIGLYLMLLFKKVTKRKIILWTHGTSVKNGFNPQKIKDKIKLFFFNLADGIYFYTNNELELLSSYLHKPKLYYLNNTINVEKITASILSLNLDKDELKIKYGISSKRIVIYCARFVKDRRPNLLIELIEKMETDDISFIIIGDGLYKPNFTEYYNVKDFGALYDSEIKAELFTLADFSFQPGWTGLSIVESFAHSVPYITLERSKDIFQCVEYSYIIHAKNGFVLKNTDDVRDKILTISESKIKDMKLFSLKYAETNLSLNRMVDNFTNGIDLINSK